MRGEQYQQDWARISLIPFNCLTEYWLFLYSRAYTVSIHPIYITINGITSTMYCTVPR